MIGRWRFSWKAKFSAAVEAPSTDPLQLFDGHAYR